MRRSMWCVLVVALGLWSSGVAGCSEGTQDANNNNAETVAEPAVEKPASTTEPKREKSSQDAGEATVERAPQEVAPEPVVETKPPAAPYTLTLFDKIRINSRKEYNGKTYDHVRNATAEFDLRDGPFQKVEMEVTLGTTCYPFAKWRDDPPPQGHRWPPNCDAFDRNFELHFDPPLKDGDPPALELVRAITPFGGPMHFAVDITHIANQYPGKHRIRVAIATWSDGKGQVSGANGGWFVTAKLKVTPGAPPRKILAVIPLFNHTYKEQDGKKKEVSFTLPEGTQETVLEYRVTGHGGGSADAACIGHADEFCKRTHRLFADGKEFQHFVPWRSDCANFCSPAKAPSGQDICKENPTGLIRSVKAPRANWCPGSITRPIVRTIPALQTPGKHTFGYLVEKVAKGGSWRVSATLIVYGKP